MGRARRKKRFLEKNEGFEEGEPLDIEADGVKVANIGNYLLKALETLPRSVKRTPENGILPSIDRG